MTAATSLVMIATTTTDLHSASNADEESNQERKTKQHELHQCSVAPFSLSSLIIVADFA